MAFFVHSLHRNLSVGRVKCKNAVHRWERGNTEHGAREGGREEGEVGMGVGW